MIAPSPDDPLGYDAFVSDDIAEDGRDATGLELVRNAIVHRLTTEKLFLVDAEGADEFGRVDFGVDVRTWVGAAEAEGGGDARAALLREALRREPGLDPSTIDVEILATAAGSKWNFAIGVSARATTELPIALTMNVNAVTVELLAQGT